jgi:uncharacterized protein (DUF779 family)
LIEITNEAKEVIRELKKHHPDLSIVIESSSCCSNSSIFVRSNPPNGTVIYLGEYEGVKVFLDPILKSVLSFNRLILDVLDFSDDSLSLETNLGKRLTLIVTNK